MNRLFNRQQKKHLYVTSGGKCEKCGGCLGEDWHAHHITRYADGGTTEITNAMALCRSCHIDIHRSTTMIEPRGWQIKALRKFLSADKKTFLLEATPGAGKTIFSALGAKGLLDDGAVDFVVCVVPTTALKGDKDAGFLGDWNKVGINITTSLRDSKPRPKDFKGAAVCYSQLPNLVSTFQTWASNGIRLGFVFDEVHHLSESNKWGAAANDCEEIAASVLSMTGTPFRGDNKKIAFVTYNNAGVAEPDAKYSYREAVRDRVCRELLFRSDDGIAEYVHDAEEHRVRISEATQENEANVGKAIFRESEWLENVILKADSTLNDYRISDINAGGLIICRPGYDENDDRHLRAVAKILKRTTGEVPVIITHEDPEANTKIEQFRNSSAKWICAVRKISEGVDIKRLRVCVMACRPGTELLFRQIVGRVVRHEEAGKAEDSTVYIAKFRQLTEWASKIAEEAAAGLTDPKPKPEKGDGNTDKLDGDYRAISASHEDGGAYSDFGEYFKPIEIVYAEKMKSNDPQLQEISIAKIAHLLRKAGVEPTASEAVQEPLHIRKKKLRADINSLARSIAYSSNPDRPDFAGVWRDIHQRAGVGGIDDLMDNYDIEKMVQVKDVLKSMMRGK